MTTCDPHWTAYLSALLTPIVAVLGSFVAFRQWRLAQNKLKLDLFDRRFSVYKAASMLLTSIMTSGKAQDEDVFRYKVATLEAKWLLSSEVAEYLDKQLYEKAVDLQTIHAEQEGLAGEARTNNLRDQRVLKEWLAAQYGVLDKHFAPFLRLQH